MDAVKGAAKKALAAQEQSLEHSAQTASALQGLKQVRSCVQFACYVVLMSSSFTTCTVPTISAPKSLFAVALCMEFQ